MRDADPSPGEVHCVDIAHEDRRPRKQRAQRADDMRDVEVARGHLVQHWGEQDEVLEADEGHVDRGSRSFEFLQLPGDVEAAEPAAEDHHASVGMCHGVWMPRRALRFVLASDRHAETRCVCWMRRGCRVSCQKAIYARIKI